MVRRVREPDMRIRTHITPRAMHLLDILIEEHGKTNKPVSASFLRDELYKIVVQKEKNLKGTTGWVHRYIKALETHGYIETVSRGRYIPTSKAEDEETKEYWASVAAAKEEALFRYLEKKMW